MASYHRNGNFRYDNLHKPRSPLPKYQCPKCKRIAELEERYMAFCDCVVRHGTTKIEGKIYTTTAKTRMKRLR